MWAHPDAPRSASRFLAWASGLFVDPALCGHQPTSAWLTSARRSQRLDAYTDDGTIWVRKMQ